MLSHKLESGKHWANPSVVSSASAAMCIAFPPLRTAFTAARRHSPEQHHLARGHEVACLSLVDATLQFETQPELDADTITKRNLAGHPSDRMDLQDVRSLSCKVGHSILPTLGSSARPR
jgi:hypothetical protein